MTSVDVVVPCYRYGRYLKECVQSVLGQGGDEIRVLIVDDASPDDTPQVADSLACADSRVSYRRHVSNLGHIRTYNEGIGWVRADYMLLLSADDYLLPGALKRATALMDAHPKVGLCFGEAVHLRDSGFTRSVRVPIEVHDESDVVLGGPRFIALCAKSGANNIVPTPTAVVRTSLLKQLGGYRSDLPHTADLELWLRLASRSCVGFIRAEQAVYRRHSVNMSTAYFEDGGLSDLRQRKAAFDAFLQTCRPGCPEADSLHAQLVRALSRQAVSYASAAFNDGRLHHCRSMCAFALDTDPWVRLAPEWAALCGKKLLGRTIALRCLHALRKAAR